MPCDTRPPPPLSFYYGIWHKHHLASLYPPAAVLHPRVSYPNYPSQPVIAPPPFPPPIPAPALPRPLPSLDPFPRFSTCPGPITENITLFNHGNCIDLSKTFKVPPLSGHVPEESLLSSQHAMNENREELRVEKALEERAVNIMKEILERSVRLVYEDEREDRRHIDAAKELNLTKAPISWLYVIQIESLISKETRMEALDGLQSSISSLNGSMDGHRRNNPSSSNNPLNPFLAACREFGKNLSPALSAVRHKIENEGTELEILVSVKTVFELIISFYYQEKGCTPSAERALQHLEEAHTTPGLTESAPVAQQLDRIDTRPNSEESAAVAGPSSANQTAIPENNSPLQEPNELGEQNGEIQNATDDRLITVFNSYVVPMTPVVAKKNSLFVNGTNPRDLQITQAAYAHLVDEWRCVIPCEFYLNATYTPENLNLMDTASKAADVQRYLTYVGCRYPDGTTLSYIPISYVRLVYESNLSRRPPILRTGSVTFAFLHVYLPNAIYQEIKRRAKNAYLFHHPNAQFVDHHEAQTVDGRMVRIEVLVKSERTVRIQDQNRQIDYPVLQALFKCRHDICGPSLMHMRFTSTKRGSQRIQLRLLLFGVTVRRTQENYNDAIFDLLQSPPGPIRTPLPVTTPWLS